MNQKIKILLIDDHQIILDSLKLLFSSIENVAVVGVLVDSRKAAAFVAANVVDVIVSDLHIPNFSGIDLTLQMKKEFPQVKILLLTMAEDAPTIRDAIRAGVNGYVLKKANKSELEKAINAVMLGRKYFSEDVILELAASPEEDMNENRPETILHLTGREIEILRLIAEELSTGDIAEKLYISIATVETHRGNLMKKLNVKSVVGMVKFAMKHGLVD